MSCIHCGEKAFLEEKYNPNAVFCGIMCQRKHYDLIGMKRSKPEETTEFMSFIVNVDDHNIYLSESPKNDNDDEWYTELKTKNIGHVVIVHNVDGPYKKEKLMLDAINVSYTRIPIADIYPDEKNNIEVEKNFEDAYQIISSNIGRTNVLVHCISGISRSPAIVTYWLAKTYGDTIDDAYAYVQRQRPIVNSYRFIDFLKTILQ
jgi:protein-tyrosine phosphatase